MGNICDANDIDRFMRSAEGKKHLESIRQKLNGKVITDVTFGVEWGSVAIILHLNDGTSFIVTQPELDVDALREEFADVLEREYYKDYPERCP